MSRTKSTGMGINHPDRDGAGAGEGLAGEEGVFDVERHDVLTGGVVEAACEPAINRACRRNVSTHAPPSDAGLVGIDLVEESLIVSTEYLPSGVVEADVSAPLGVSSEDAVEVVHLRASGGAGGADGKVALFVVARGGAKSRLGKLLGVGGIEPLAQGAEGARRFGRMRLAGIVVKEAGVFPIVVVATPFA